MGEVINGGFGLTIDGTKEVEEKLINMLFGMLIMELQEEIGQEMMKQYLQLKEK